MTNLTDLPDEAIDTIFREFLSKELVDHKYLCRWKAGTNAKRNRANLCSLALVSRRLSAIAVPLLYEQLFHSQDIAKILSKTVRNGTSARHLASIRYLIIGIEDSDPAGPMKVFIEALRKSLLHCVDVAHLNLWFSGAAADTSAFLLNLAQMPGLRKLRSLWISLDISMDGRHNLFRDCCQFPLLTGIYIRIPEGARSIGSPEGPLIHLKRLEFADLRDAQEASACMALAQAQGLEALTVWTPYYTSPSVTSLSELLGECLWESLVSLSIHTESSLVRDTFVTEPVRLPALQNLQLTFAMGTLLRDAMPIVPYGLQLFSIGPRDLTQLLECLTLIAEDDWLSRKMQCIGLYFPALFQNNWSGEAGTKAHVMKVAQRAIDTTRLKGIILEPENLIEIVAGLRLS